jgi:hypothetical protein
MFGMVFGLVVVFVVLILYWGGPMAFAAMFYPTEFALAYVGTLVVVSLVTLLIAELSKGSAAKTGSAGWGAGGQYLLLRALAISNILPLMILGLRTLFW